ncbi:MAG: hypothetical protein JW882_20125 [Deltaproteobacteria bacterium]|nr:hypothetical protein [Deltaproteobacteria bacterium]
MNTKRSCPLGRNGAKNSTCGISIAGCEALFTGANLGSNITAHGACQAGGDLSRSFHIDPS